MMIRKIIIKRRLNEDVRTFWLRVGVMIRYFNGQANSRMMYEFKVM